MTTATTPAFVRWHILYIDSARESHNLFLDMPHGASKSQALVMRRAKRLAGMSGVRGKTPCELYRDSSSKQQQYSFRPLQQ